jgi:hypothetical protein
MSFTQAVFFTAFTTLSGQSGECRATLFAPGTGFNVNGYLFELVDL